MGEDWEIFILEVYQEGEEDSDPLEIFTCHSEELLKEILALKKLEGYLGSKIYPQKQSKALKKVWPIKDEGLTTPGKPPMVVER